MDIFIDVSSREKKIYGYYNNNVFSCEIINGENISLYVEEIINYFHLTFHDIKNILLIRGPGGFVALRLACMYVLTFLYLYPEVKVYSVLRFDILDFLYKKQDKNNQLLSYVHSISRYEIMVYKFQEKVFDIYIPKSLPSSLYLGELLDEHKKILQERNISFQDISFTLSHTDIKNILKIYTPTKICEPFYSKAAIS
jgi:tRNA A37 threonylcarbamoyladenosine modification protein TsaB